MQTYVVDSFTDEMFKGNPAGVCLARGLLNSDLMLSIARELNFSETAFVFDERDGKYPIRYFSPKMEIPLCGHATLAAARVLSAQLSRAELEFVTGEGVLLPVRREGDLLEMEFPNYTTVAAIVPTPMLEALGIATFVNGVYNDETKILLIEIVGTEALRSMTPDFLALRRSHDTINGVLVTARSGDGQFDFHSRYFWPWSGTDEDPVTGGTHTFLAGYWSSRLGKSILRSYQSSARTGFMEVEMTDRNTVLIRGNAVIVLEGALTAFDSATQFSFTRTPAQPSGQIPR